MKSELTYKVTTVTIYDENERAVVMNMDYEEVLHSEFGFILTWFRLDTSTGDVFVDSSDLSVSILHSMIVKLSYFLQVGR